MRARQSHGPRECMAGLRSLQHCLSGRLPAPELDLLTLRLRSSERSVLARSQLPRLSFCAEDAREVAFALMTMAISCARGVTRPIKAPPLSADRTQGVAGGPLTGEASSQFLKAPVKMDSTANLCEPLSLPRPPSMARGQPSRRPVAAVASTAATHDAAATLGAAAVDPVAIDPVAVALVAAAIAASHRRPRRPCPHPRHHPRHHPRRHHRSRHRPRPSHRHLHRHRHCHRHCHCHRHRHRHCHRHRHRHCRQQSARLPCERPQHARWVRAPPVCRPTSSSRSCLTSSSSKVSCAAPWAAPCLCTLRMPDAAVRALLLMLMLSA